jgi:hypothetical protein
MPELEDMHQFAARLLERRNRAALLLTPDLPGQQDYAARLAGALNAMHFDALSRFQEDETLLSRLSYFSSDELLALIAEQQDHPLVVVSGIEFLLAAWISQGEPKQVKQSLCQKIELWQQSPAFILVTHEDPVFAAFQPKRFPGSRVVLHTSQTLALE